MSTSLHDLLQRAARHPDRDTLRALTRALVREGHDSAPSETLEREATTEAEIVGGEEDLDDFILVVGGRFIDPSKGQSVARLRWRPMIYRRVKPVSLRWWANYHADIERQEREIQERFEARLAEIGGGS